MKYTTTHGEVDVAFEQLTLFFNNNTIEYGFDAYTQGMTKNDWIDALELRGFEHALAKAFADKYWLWHTTWQVDGRGTE